MGRVEIAAMAHFIPADRAFTCHECGDMQAANTLTMHVIERGPGMARCSVSLCYACGVLYLESQDHPVSGGDREFEFLRRRV